MSSACFCVLLASRSWYDMYATIPVIRSIEIVVILNAVDSFCCEMFFL